jgi:hypothetical protein
VQREQAMLRRQAGRRLWDSKCRPHQTGGWTGEINGQSDVEGREGRDGPWVETLKSNYLDGCERLVS